jgi:hypothetical protein
VSSIDRHAIEAELMEHELVTLDVWCTLLCIPRDGWHRVRALAVPFSTAAAVRLADRRRIDDGLTAEAALLDACARLGIEPETLRSRLRRWPLSAIGRVESAGKVHGAPGHGRRIA